MIDSIFHHRYSGSRYYGRVGKEFDNYSQVDMMLNNVVFDSLIIGNNNKMQQSETGKSNAPLASLLFSMIFVPVCLGRNCVALPSLLPVVLRRQYVVLQRTSKDLRNFSSSVECRITWIESLINISDTVCTHAKIKLAPALASQANEDWLSLSQN